MRTRVPQILLTAALMGMVFAVFIPVAEAQGAGPQTSVVLSLTPPSEKVKPLQGQITFSGKATYTGDPSSSGNIVGVPVSYKVTKAPAWAAVTVSPGSDVITLTSSQTSVSGSSNFNVAVTASDQAPAFQSDTIEITATVTPSNPGATAKSASQAVPIQADYFSILDVQLAQAIQQDRPQSTVTFPVKITNLGNGATKVNFDIAPEGNPQNLNVLVPGPVTLQSKQAGGNQISAEIPLQIQLPHKNGYMNEAGAVRYKITSNYALDSKLKGDETTLSVLVTTKGFYVPGPEPIVLVGLLVAVAAAFRRR
jgi:hypothetical protein